MDTQKFIPFFIVTSIIFLLFDSYFLISWRKFVNERGYNRWVFFSVLILSIIALIFLGYSTYIRLINHSLENFERIFEYFPAIWYLSKLMIVPFLIFKDILKFFKKITKKRIKSTLTQSIPQNTARRKFIQNTGWVMAGVPFFVITDGLIRTTNNFKIHYVDIPISKLSSALNGLKIVQISDIHAGSFTSAKPLTEVLFLIETLQPDITFVTGDFVNFSHKELQMILPQLKNLHAKHGVYGCLGNHDHYMSPSDHPSLIQKIQETGINLLINENITLDIFNEQLQIAGTDNSSYRMTYGDMNKALSGLKDYLPTVLLCHDPTNWDKEIRRKTFVDLTLSGHTHGGQIGIEYDAMSFSPASLVYKQSAGLYKDKDQYLYVNRGIGTVGPPLRIGIRPEITLITLRSVENFASSTSGDPTAS